MAKKKVKKLFTVKLSERWDRIFRGVEADSPGEAIEICRSSSDGKLEYVDENKDAHEATEEGT